MATDYGRSDSHQNRTLKHCIIGAGFSGLPIAKKLNELGEPFEILDKNAGIGGLWHTGVYRDAHLISSKLTTEYPDFPMPQSYPDFPSKPQMQQYFESYADHFGLTPHLQLNTEVSRVLPADDHSSTGRWQVILTNGKTRLYQTVTIANGHNWSPRKVTFPGEFSGEIMHSNAYESWEQLQGKRVLVVGYGNTGCDISVDASRVAQCAHISMRSGAYFFPKMFAGTPLADLLYFSPVHSNQLDRFFAKIITRLAVGDLEKYGVKKPVFRPLDKHPIVNTDLINSIRHGRVKVRPNIKHFDGEKVYFEDGSHDSFDLVVYATGYNVDFPMLHPEDGIINFKTGLPVLFMQLMSPNFRGLFTPGIGQARTGGGPVYQASGYLFSRMIALEAKSPKGVMADLKNHPAIKLASSPLVAKKYRTDLVTRANMASRGLGDLKRMLTLMTWLLNSINAPNAPSEKAERGADLPRANAT